MANKKINELDVRSSLSLSDLMAVGDPSTGYLYKTTISDLKTLTGAGVISFNTRFGAVMPAEGDYNLTQLGDVIITSPTANQVLQFNGSNWVNVAAADLSGFVPYTGATSNVNLGTYHLSADIINVNEIKALTSGGVNIYSNSGTHIALMGAGGGAGTTLYGGLIGTTGSFSSSGSGNTLDITHSSGSGIALNITKSGNGEGLYINKTSGSGNAATIVGTLEATTLVKTGGTSSQFLKADGSVDGTAYATAASISGTTNYIPKFTSSGAIGNSVLFDNGTSVGFGTVSPNVSGYARALTISSSQSALELTSASNVVQGTVASNAAGLALEGIGTQGIRFFTSASGATSIAAQMFADRTSQFYGALSGTSLSMSGAGTFGGNVGVGTVSPQGRLHITGGYTGFEYNSAGAYPSYNTYFGAIGTNFSNSASELDIWNTVGGGFAFRKQTAATSQTALMYISSAGNVGIGTSSPSQRLTIGATNGYPIIDFYNSGTGFGDIGYNAGTSTFNLSSYSTTPLAIYTNGSERMRITSGGDVLINTTTTDGTNKLIVNGGVKANTFTATNGAINVRAINNDDLPYINFSNNAGSFDWGRVGGDLEGNGDAGLYFQTKTGAGLTTKLTISSTGAATFSSSVTATGFFESSDSRYKSLIADRYNVPGIEAITPKLYKKNGKTELGYFAQDFIGVLDSAITKSNEGMLSLSYREVLVAKIYALEREIEKLKNK